MTDQTTGTEVPAPPIVARGLTKRYGSLAALDGVDLEVPTGVVLALVGSKDAGKTTAIRLLTGLTQPTSGEVLVAGVRPGTRDGMRVRGRMGVVLEEPRFYEWMTGRELVAFAAGLVGVDRRDVAERCAGALAQVGLAKAADRRIGSYSAAMRQRLGLAQAMVGRPDLLVLDEPAAALDPAGRRELLEVIREARGAATVVLSTDTLADAELVADRVAVLDRGRIIVDEPLAVLVHRFAQPVYAIDAERGQDSALAALRTRLRLEPWVGGTTVAGRLLQVAVLDPERAARDLLPIVVAAGVRVASFTQRRPTLEDLLLLTGRTDERTDDRSTGALAA